eukprot:TRINITY_DN751_c7_g1_i1.p1 TRINITY_DN751_c7_g1~~TRINITY_DN751_c7_g1_i1.p1  ORF type:complete len:348 (+),score=45.21 TRINITY_DN751_c7_g1_i1:29-1072(+)
MTEVVDVNLQSYSDTDLMIVGQKLQNPEFNVRSVTLSKNPNRASIKDFTNSFKLNYTLSILSLNSINMQDDDVRILVKSLQNNLTLTSLDLSGNLIGPNGAKYISELIVTNPIIILNLSDNNIKSEGVKYIADSLKSNRVIIKSLLLSCVNNDRLDNQHFAQIICKSRTIRHLNISCNQISSDEMNSISLAIQNNITITYLDISYNYLIGISEIKKLLSSLTKSSVRTISIKGIYNLGHLYHRVECSEFFKELLESLKENHTLTRVLHSLNTPLTFNKTLYHIWQLNKSMSRTWWPNYPVETNLVCSMNEHHIPTDIQEVIIKIFNAKLRISSKLSWIEKGTRICSF